MLTVGIDLAAEPERTAVAWITWEPGRASVTNLVCGADDPIVLDAICQADKAGMDCPLGWPTDFVAFVAAHQAGQAVLPADGTGRDWRRSLTTRLTDRVVREETQLLPLSVSADRIGHVAMRCAGLLAQLADQGQPVDRSGSGVVVEVYPAASLKRWGLPFRSYKGPRDAQVLGQLVDQLKAKARWLELGEHEGRCRRSHDAADAVIAALTARAVALGLATVPDALQASAATAEGWIAIPNSSLDRIAAAPA
jgi:predicted nuclease with RNAse H fold